MIAQSSIVTSRKKTRDFVSVRQMREIDKKAVRYGIPIELMMENAGKEIALHVLKNVKNSEDKKIVCIAGKGNNAGGVISAARHLTCLGNKVTMVLLYPKKSVSKPSAFHLFLTRKNPMIDTITVKKSNLKKILSIVAKSDVIIDGIFGTGFHSNVDEPIYSVISQINKSHAYVISNDVPSGTDADSGDIKNIAVKSDFVIVLHKPKLWMKNSQVKFKVVEIGIPQRLS